VGRSLSDEVTAVGAAVMCCASAVFGAAAAVGWLASSKASPALAAQPGLGSLGEWVGGLGTMAAVLVAIHALRVEARRHREDARRNVRPVLGTITGIAEGCEKASITLGSQGLGPAVVKSYRVSFNGLQVQPQTSGSKEELAKATARLGVSAEFASCIPGVWLPVGGQLRIVTFKPLPNDEVSAFDRLSVALSVVEVEIEFASVFDEVFTYRCDRLPVDPTNPVARRLGEASPRTEHESIALACVSSLEGK
jgi:hypothetical protein